MHDIDSDLGVLVARLPVGPPRIRDASRDNIDLHQASRDCIDTQLFDLFIDSRVRHVDNNNKTILP